MKKILTVLVALSFLIIGCAKKEVKKEQASFKISGMTCEIGCAKTIASKLSKQEGVLDAKVIFKDSLATIEYDANVTNRADLMAFVNGIGDGKTYKTCNKKSCDVKKKDCNTKKSCDKAKETSMCAGKCDEACKKACAEGDAKCKEDCMKKCNENTKKSCDSKKDTTAKACKSDCKMKCCEIAENIKPKSCECKSECCKAA